ncbi:uncharacterized protein LOC132193173 [Neocloeon triangulifer]|uniref:uncharacterized protein LOC132193173 n=1 Tax=Neocloeon triangulifer TaxID=2078957 RepID=UPI00286EBEAD|nr:uncharacterized protein LOC132193173 [Neocloeon triangulifer]
MLDEELLEMAKAHASSRIKSSVKSSFPTLVQRSASVVSNNVSLLYDMYGPETDFKFSNKTIELTFREFFNRRRDEIEEVSHIAGRKLALLLMNSTMVTFSFNNLPKIPLEELKNGTSSVEDCDSDESSQSCKDVYSDNIWENMVLAKLVKVAPNLTELVDSYSYIGTDYDGEEFYMEEDDLYSRFEHILPYMMQLKKIQTFNFEGNPLDDDDLVSIAEHLPELRTLLFSSYYLGVDGIRALAKLPHLESVIFEGATHECSLEEVDVMMSFMKELPHLKYVGCEPRAMLKNKNDHGPHRLPSFRRATDLGIKYLYIHSKINKKGKNTRLPNLSSMTIESLETKQVKNVLELGLQNLKELYFKGVAIAQVLPILQSTGRNLEVLNMKGVYDLSILQILDLCPNLKSLYFSCSEHAIVNATLDQRNFQFLEDVCISTNTFGYPQKCPERFLVLLLSAPNLKKVHLSGVGYKSSDYKKVVEKLRSCDILRQLEKFSITLSKELVCEELFTMIKHMTAWCPTLATLKTGKHIKHHVSEFEKSVNMKQQSGLFYDSDNFDSFYADFA